METFLNFELFSIGDSIFRVANLLYIIVILIASRLFLLGVRVFVRRRLEKIKSVDRGRSYAMLSIARYFIYTVVMILILQVSGMNITVLVASSTALFVGLGLGLQNTFNDFVSGVILLFEGSLEIGDVVEVKGIVGRVIKIGMRTSTIVSRDDVTIIVPNSRFVSDEVVNWTHQEKHVRFHIKVGVAYGSDTELVRDTLIATAQAHPQVAENPSPIVFFQSFGESALQFEVLFWTNKTFEAERTLSELRFSIDKAFRKNKIRIAFPQRDIHIIPPPDQAPL
jgi:small-conductance mechanosensitive channel